MTSVARLLCEPALREWKPRRQDVPASKLIWASGHQASLWHPGILAKFLAVDLVAQSRGGSSLHLIVDHDEIDALKLELPVLEKGDRLRIETIRLAPQRLHLPLCSQPAVESDTVLRTLADLRKKLGGSLPVSLEPLEQAWVQPMQASTLGEQMAGVLGHLLRGVGVDIPVIYSSQLLQSREGSELVQRLLQDAVRAVRAYNEAVRAFPQADVRELVIERDRMELPLWALTPGSARRPVYADLSDSRSVLLTLEDGSRAEMQQLAPKALMLTAVMRSQRCDLMVHGKGGGIYDRVMEHWWQAWTGEALASMAVVSADVHLPLGVPVASRDELRHAVWMRHHVPSNLDRYLASGNGAAAAGARKRELLASMERSRSATDRQAMFQEIHAINEALVQANPQEIQRIEGELERARLGVLNHAIATKRDWCFALYPREAIEELRGALAATL